MVLEINNGYQVRQNYNITPQKLKNKAAVQTFTSRRNFDKTNNGEFDANVAANNFCKGLLSPITAIIKHPIATIGVVGATALACSVAPILAPATAIVFGAMGIYEFGKSSYNIVKHSASGEYDKAEKDFEGLGQGTINTVLTALGMRQSARVTKEAQLLSETKATKLSVEQISKIKDEVKSLTLFKSFKESLKLYTTKEGRQAFMYQFKKPVIKERLQDLKNIIVKKKEQTKESFDIKEEFAKTPEGIKRAKMTTEEISQEVSKLAKESFDQYGIPEELRPKIEIVKKDAKTGGGYYAQKHTIEINETAYREGAFDLPNTIKHEATHAKEALIRETLTFTKKEQLTKEYLLNKIQTGDNNTVAYDTTIFENATIKPPKMFTGMKTDFAKLAQENIYKIGSNGLDKKQLTKLVEPLIDKYPEFISQYQSKEEALDMLTKYAQSHQLRYKVGTTTAINLPADKVAKLGYIDESTAINSFKGILECLDGNMSYKTVSGNMGLGGDFTQYEFGAEEVLAQLSGNKFEISHLEQELATLRKRPNFDAKQEAYLLSQIESAQKTIKYKSMGQKYYKLFMDYKHNPSPELAKEINTLAVELNKLQPHARLHIENINGKETIMVTLKGERFVLKEVKPGVTEFIPYNTTSTADIMAS
ncbi:MAG: hypothetical protein DK841_06500 [Candidatus Melainabacteria bacterium]|nr:MAG: hypothetical protein DK841_06500 [Candidatus Melainabacteria bacterium]